MFLGIDMIKRGNRKSNHLQIFVSGISHPRHIATPRRLLGLSQHQASASASVAGATRTRPWFSVRFLEKTMEKNERFIVVDHGTDKNDRWVDFSMAIFLSITRNNQKPEYGLTIINMANSAIFRFYLFDDGTRT